ncbi:hypothetical protein [Bacillus bingmayongensis]|uniref:hypothetical protein n=1 Tax=Bacillus bingmayongensis TaxID=1150157 RepID=UPI0003610748|nr:hypothetical protein [Bacillus bingmayongensis]
MFNIFDTTTNFQEFIYCDLDRFFNQTSKKVSDYPKIQKVIREHKKKLWSFGSFFEETLKTYSIEDMLFRMSNQCFTKQFFFGAKRELGYYYLTWDISKLQETIQENEIIPNTLIVDNLISEAQDNGVNLNTIDVERENNEPIIIAQHPVANNNYRGIIIDGNHRIAQAYKKGHHQILAYVLPPFVHMKGLLLDLDVFLFKLAYNFSVINKFVDGMNTTSEENIKKELHDTLFKVLYKI